MTRQTYNFTAGPNGATFQVYFSQTMKRPRVRLIEADDSPNWDYDDEDAAREMSAAIAGCRSIAEAAEILVGQG